MERNTAKLTIKHAGKFGIIYFQGGQIVHAEFDPDVGEKALFRLLGLPSGKFKVESGVRPPLVSINTHWNNLLLEGLHQLDAKHTSDDRQNIDLIEMLMNVKGVKRAAIISHEGNIIKSDFEDQEEFLTKAFVFYQAEKLSSLMKLKNPRFLTLVAGKNRIILTEKGQKIVFMEIDAKYQLETVIPFVDQVLS